MSEEPPKRIGFIGLSTNFGNWAARSHIHHLPHTPHYTITALQNSTLASAARTAAHFSLDNPSVTTHSTPSSLATSPTVDIVAVCVKVPEHYALTRPALLAGKDVFVEWPLARNLAEASELTALARSQRVRTMVGLQARQSPAILAAKALIADGSKLGRVLGTHMHGAAQMIGPAMLAAHRYVLPVDAGANMVTIAFSHCVDALCFVLGEFRDVGAVLANHYPQVTLLDGEMKPVGSAEKTCHDYMSVNGTLESGAVADVMFSGGHSHTGRTFYWEIVGEKGTLVLEAKGSVQMFHPSLKFAPNTGDPLGPPAPGDFSFNVGKAWDAWAGVGLDKGHSVTTFEDALLRHKMIEAVYRSAEKATRETYL
ncbi:hypothetical protein BDV95DRAFT_627002 [Massariosphaeria phaeospora]|uniref:Uncharacterized protein n=1 Tax=Massariosphaeria phaeospora TaxID=100035 RepID=A0A7C8MIM0_9PLEO|nr:hypothetical protein BDV95DRAFT_627002 [Massariosphaeria phaeospora]